MRNARGVTLIEAIVYLAIFVVVVNLIGLAISRFTESHHRLAQIKTDVESAERFLRDVKGDLRRARRATVEPAKLKLRFAGEAEAVYEFLEEGSVVRTGDGPDREYRYGFETVKFSAGAAKTVTLEIELRKRDPASPYRPRWITTVFCREREN